MNRMSERLKAVAGMVKGGGVLADIGCDHAYIPIELVLSGQFRSAVAADVREGPLGIAAGNIREYGLSDRIETRRSDGFAAFVPGEADTAVIAGMGGPLMSRILMQYPEVTGSFRELVLEPQSDTAMLRRTLLDHAFAGVWFRIAEEDMIVEDGKYYPIIRAVRSEENASLKEPYEYCFGPELLRQRHPVLEQYLKRQLEHCRQLCRTIECMDGNVSGRAHERLEEIREELRLTEAALECYGV